jgi:hypothetical protein
MLRDTTSVDLQDPYCFEEFMPLNQLSSPSALVSLVRQRRCMYAAILGCATSVQHGQPQKRIVGVGRSISSQLVDWKTDGESWPCRHSCLSFEEEHAHQLERIASLSSRKDELPGWNSHRNAIPDANCLVQHVAGEDCHLFGRISLVFRHTTTARECALVNLAHLDFCLQVISNSNQFFWLADLFIESLSFVDGA